MTNSDCLDATNRDIGDAHVGGWLVHGSGPYRLPVRRGWPDNPTNPPELEARMWPVYNTARRATMLLGAHSSIADALLDDERRVWDGIPDSVIGY